MKKKKSIAKKNSELTIYIEKPLFSILLITALGCIIYSNSFDCSFHFDDTHNIINNEAIRNIYEIKTIWNFSNTRFITFLTFALNYHFNGLDVSGYHVVNLFIHIATALLVWWAVLQTLSTPVMQNRNISKSKKIIALWCGLIFVSHPLMTQSVTYIVQRLASLATLFYMASLCLYLKGRLSQQKIPSILFFIGSSTTAALGMLTKEIVFTLPFALFLFEFSFFHEGSIKDILTNNIFFLYSIPPLILTIIIPYLLSYRFNITWDIFIKSYFYPLLSQRYGDPMLSSSIYLFTQFRVIVTYIRLLFFPFNQNLDYDFPASSGFWELGTVASFAFLVLVIVTAIWLFPRKRIMAVGIFWFFLTLTVESSIIPIRNVIFEHRVYLPMFGFILILVSGLYYILGENRKITINIILISLIAIYSGLTLKRNMVWKNDITLWKDIVKKSPNKDRSHMNLGEVYFSSGLIEEGLNEFNIGLKLNPKNFKVLNNIGFYYYTKGNYKESISYYDRGLAIEPNSPDLHVNKASALVMTGQHESGLEHFLKAVDINSQYIIKLKAAAGEIAKSGSLPDAEKYYSEVLNRLPDDFETLKNLGKIQLSQKKYQEAVSYFSTALKINPGDTELLTNVGKVLLKMEKANEANPYFSEVVRLQPNDVEAHINLSVCLRAQGNITESERELLKANILLDKLKPK
ncbi:MAG: tetratricopeptide repeat protein [Candidatus Latescibacteria bacterium]|nr:tetratricopeptide repeat protein [Candidatus Latescibacterota bacterium]